MIEIVTPGLHSTIQDRGRSGYYALGVPPSGSMDVFAHDAANALVGNAPDAAGVEVTFLGPTLTFQATTVIAVTGGLVDVTFDDGQQVPLWTSQLVRAGQTVTFGTMRSGARAYIAVRGGIDAPVVMGSRSTYTLSRIGGIEGRTLKAGDILPIGTDVLKGSRRRAGVRVPEELRPAYPTEQEIRVVPGLCDYRLAAQATEVLYSAPYAVTVEANRTGYRFQGESLTFLDRTAPFGAGHDPSNVVNLGYPVGSIQVPSGAELICLLRDAVTGGGYATIGTVISVDLDLIAQSKAPDRALFRPVTIETALAERAVRARRLAKITQLALT
jgi:biotin-dependent carboxylase-like uncharacterized protein